MMSENAAMKAFKDAMERKKSVLASIASVKGEHHAEVAELAYLMMVVQRSVPAPPEYALLLNNYYAVSYASLCKAYKIEPSESIAILDMLKPHVDKTLDGFIEAAR